MGKAILGLILVLITIIALVHLPPVQKQITHALSNYLTSKIKARVEIVKINFSILGNVGIEGLEVWDPTDNKILSADKIKVNSSIFKLVKGDFIFDEVLIAGVKVNLIQQEEGLNIQYILNAFRPEETQATKSNDLTLEFKRVQFENIAVKFTSTITGTTIAARLDKFTTQAVEFSTNPNKMVADQVYLQHAVVDILTSPHPEAVNNLVTSATNQPGNRGADSGIIFEIGDIVIAESDFSLHKDLVMNTPKFDPSHITLQSIELSLSDFLVRNDTLAAAVNSLSAQSSEFNLSKANADLFWSGDRVVVSDLDLATSTSELHADFMGWYDLNSAKDIDHAQVEIAVVGKINPGDLAYFLSDSLMKHFNHWQPAELTLEGNYHEGKGKIKTLDLKTGTSQLHAEGNLNDVLNPEKVNWQEMVVNASIGTEFKKTLTPFTRNINIPPAVSLHLISSGNPKNISVDGKVTTTWGNLIAIGQVSPQSKNTVMDIKLTGERIDLEKWMDISSLGPMDFTVGANGLVGQETNIEIKGLINEIETLDQVIHNIAFQSRIENTNGTVSISIDDPDYQSVLSSEISFVKPMMFITRIELDSFKLGRLLHMDSTLILSGATKSKILIDESSLEGYVEGDRILLQNQFMEYLLDSMALHALISPTASNIEYYTSNAKARLASNFGIKDSPKLIQTWSGNILKAPDNLTHPTGNRLVDFNIDMENASLFQLLGIDVNNFSSLKILGRFDEEKQTTMLQATTGKFKGYGISLDTLNTNIMAVRDSVNASIHATQLFYNSLQIGNLDFDILSKGETALSNLVVSNDSITLLGLKTRILPADSGAFAFVDKLLAFDNEYLIDPENSIFISNKNIVLNHFKITRDDMQLSLEGDVSAFDISIKNADLTSMNFMISPDTTVINKGHLSGTITYSRDQQLNLKAEVDSLSLYNSSPFAISATAVREGNQVPFQFLVTNESNKIDVKGNYFSDDDEVDASLLLDVSNLELFDFLVSNVIDEMDGTLKGEATVSGPIQKPAVKGYLQFLDVGLTTANPKLTFNLQDDKITLDNGLLFQDFKIYDEDHNPLTINGNVSTEDYQSFAYDLQIIADHYALINKPDSASGKVRGLLVIDSDIKLKGNDKDTNVAAKLTIKDATKLTFVTSSDDIDLLKSEGIIDFIDPLLGLDTTVIEQSVYLYDSLIASLPHFNLNSTITIEENASVRIIINEQSGDYIETTGGAKLELGYDRTGNLNLAGNYIIKNGIYRMSFYDLVKKNFTLVQGSSINWSGNPENGDLNIKTIHTVESNSIGLIGHEVGENEKSIYKRSLNYEVGININGTIEKPIISFSLDLPQNERVNFPVLANKLDRLRQPEFASELNKQVFGLIVLGGFLPESSADVNSSVIATTALSNSVNSLLSSQLNRFASQYIKGVSIDVGIQSFSDHSAPGGNTQTAMDVRVSKKMMNDRLSFEIGGNFDINQDQSGGNTGNNYRGDIAIIYDLTGNGDKQLKLFNNETFDIIFQEVRNTGISLIVIREFANKEEKKMEKEKEKENRYKNKK